MVSRPALKPQGVTSMCLSGALPISSVAARLPPLGLCPGGERAKVGVFCMGTAKAKSFSSQQLGMHAPAPQALLEELQLSVSSYSLCQITGNIIFKSIRNEKLSDRSSVSGFES